MTTWTTPEWAGVEGAVPRNALNVIDAAILRFQNKHRQAAMLQPSPPETRLCEARRELADMIHRDLFGVEPENWRNPDWPGDVCRACGRTFGTFGTCACTHHPAVFHDLVARNDEAVEWVNPGESGGIQVPPAMREPIPWAQPFKAEEQP